MEFPIMPEEAIRQNPDAYNWTLIASSLRWNRYSMQFIRDFEQRMNWVTLSAGLPCPCPNGDYNYLREIIKNFGEKLDWAIVSTVCCDEEILRELRTQWEHGQL